MIIIEELSYSFHLGSDKNKRNTSRVSAKNNQRGTTSLSNNAIQNAQTLSKVDKHNYRKYDNEQDLIVIVKGTTSLYKDVKDLYAKEFDKARIEYNDSQTREDRKIKDYFTHISNNSKNDLACEIIIELGDKKYWDTKDDFEKKKMTNVFKEQVKDLGNIVPSFKIISAIIHYDETSPHMHIVGVPVKDGNKNGMSKQVGKTSIFTKDSLKEIQDKMRTLCIESFNKEYNSNHTLKKKLKGRNQDINVSDMGNYQQLKDEIEKNKIKLEQLDNKSKILDNTSNDIDTIIKNVKTTKLNKNNYILTENEKNKIDSYINDVKITNKKFQGMSVLSVSFDNFKEEIDKYKKIINDYQDKNKALFIRNNALSTKVKEQEEKIDELEEENFSLKKSLLYFKQKFIKLTKFLKDKLFSWGTKDPIYKQVIDDLYDKNILNDKELESIKGKDDYDL